MSVIPTLLRWMANDNANPASRRTYRSRSWRPRKFTRKPERLTAHAPTRVTHGVQSDPITSLQVWSREDDGSPVLTIRCPQGS